MKNCFRKLNIFTILLFVISTGIFAQNYNIDYFGIVVTDIDSNMAKMTSDLYYTQLCEIQSFSVSDQRISASLSESPTADSFQPGKLSFYTEINKKTDSEIWTATIHVYNKSSNTELTKSKDYDSFYKILVEPKQNLQDSITSLINNQIIVPISFAANSPQEKLAEIDFSKKPATISTEALSGNWTGEKYIDKVVIMKGGRGFVILKNGVTMNVTVTVKGSEITILQTGKTNASFFPELPRSLALNAAVNAQPVSWTLHSEDENTLVGKKNTLLPGNNDSFEQGTLEVVWKRLN